MRVTKAKTGPRAEDAGSGTMALMLLIEPKSIWLRMLFKSMCKDEVPEPG